MPATDHPAERLDHGSLVDVDGVHVGHHQRSGRGWQTGTTAVVFPEGAVAAVDVRGGGPGTRETDALAPGNLVDRVHGLCLSGGSAYGLSAADGVMAHLEQRHLGVPVGTEPHEVVPVVPAAVIFDLGRGGVFDNRPDAEFGRRAAAAARHRPFQRGAVGAGTGAHAGGLQGGLGTASTVVDCAGTTIHVAALAVVNASGSLIEHSTGLPWTALPGLRRPTAAERRTLRDALSPAASPLNTTIGVVVTDAIVDRPEVGRLALAAHDGLARAIRPAHSLVDGDTVFAASTERHALPLANNSYVREAASRTTLLNLLATAAADTFATACADAIVSARSLGEAPAYRDLCPSAFRALTGGPT